MCPQAFEEIVRLLEDGKTRISLFSRDAVHITPKWLTKSFEPMWCIDPKTGIYFVFGYQNNTETLSTAEFNARVK